MTQPPKTVDAAARSTFQVGDVVADLNDPKRAFCVVEKIHDDGVLIVFWLTDHGKVWSGGLHPTHAKLLCRLAATAPTPGGDWNAAIEAAAFTADQEADRWPVHVGSSARVAAENIRALTRPTPTAAEPEGGEQPVAWRWHWRAGDEPDVWAYSETEMLSDKHKHAEPLYDRPSSPAVSGETVIPSSDDMDARFAWLEAKAADMGYRLVADYDHSDSPHSAASPQPEAGAAVTEHKTGIDWYAREIVAKAELMMTGQASYLQHIAKCADAILAILPQAGQSEAS